MNPPFINIGSRSFSPTYGKIHLSESPSLSSYSISANSPTLSPAETLPRRFSSPTNGGSGSARRIRSSQRLHDAAYSDRFIPSRLSTNLEDALEKMENKDSSSKDKGTKNDIMQENLVIMNNLLRSELLGQQAPDTSNENRLDGQAKTPTRKDTSSSNLFKFRNSPVGSASFDGSCPSSGTNGIGGPSNNGIHPLHSASSEFTFPFSSGSKLMTNYNGTSSTRTVTMSPKKPVRKISKTPFKVLDAPSLQDDYYLNLVDWSHANILSVALGSSVYLWSACTSKVTKLCDLGPDDSVTSISWATSGNYISVGANSGKIQIWDCTTCRVVRELQGHESRVGTMAWSSTLLASGSRDRNIYLQDIRVRGSANNSNSNSSSNNSNNSSNSIYNMSMSRSRDSYIAEESAHNFVSEIALARTTMDFAAGPRLNRQSSNDYAMNVSPSPGAQGSPFRPPAMAAGLSPPPAATSPLASLSVVRQLSGHKQEVCGLKWSFDEKMLASGGNDNKLFVWDAGQGRTNDPICRFEDHSAAVKAVAWSPHQSGLLASGGGTADRHIRFWNALTSVPLHKIDTGSQVCNLMWSKNVNEIVSTHGYSLNQVIVWKYPSMQKIATLTGHSLRVLYLAMSPDGQSVVTGAGDETLRFWNIFPGPRNKTGFRIGPSLLSPSGTDIR